MRAHAWIACLLAVLALAGCGPLVEVSRQGDPSDTDEAEAEEQAEADESRVESTDIAEPDPASEGDEAEGGGEEGAEAGDAQPRPLTVAFGGDVHGEPPVAGLLADGGNPLDGVAPTFQSADLTVVNLETAVGDAGAPADKQFTFQASEALVGALRDGGVDVVTVANNHALDYGVAGLEETIALAEGAGLGVVGAGRDATEAYAPHYADIDGRTVAVVGLTRVIPVPEWAATGERPGMASAYEPGLPDALAAIEEASERADWVVVAVHWGQERHPCPNEPQRDLARAFVDAGADVVAGHHPHVLQGVQQLDDAVVAYSLGNFVWYAKSDESGTTGVLTVELGGDEGASWAFEPAMIDDTGSPQPVAEADPERAEEISALLADRSPGGDACADTDWP